MKRLAKHCIALSAVVLTMPAVAQTAAAPAAAPVTPPTKPVAQMTPQELSAWKKANGSYYVQCDGMPDNMSAGETAARLIALSAVVGLLAPPPEAADPAKRKFGAEGVAACTRLIEGDKREDNASRRQGLILARGAHRIEAKDYAGAVADAELARKDAADSGLSTDTYWANSRGRGADLLEAAALYRMGKTADASAVVLRRQEAMRYALIPLLSTPQYFALLPDAVPGEAAYGEAINRTYPWFAAGTADRLERVGKFAEAAAVRDALIDLDKASTPATIGSLIMAQAAVSHALAGNTARAAELAKAAQENFDKRKAEGKPDPNPAEVVEQLDLYNIIRTAAAGDAKTARRLFAARSQWVSASFGSTVEVNRRLRNGAAADELIGGLQQTPAQLWKTKADEDLAKALARDTDNKSLFGMFPGAVKAGDFESVAKDTWKTQKSPWLLKPKKPDPEMAGWDTLFRYGATPTVMTQAYMLHAALLAKSRGHQGFVILPVIAPTIFAVKIKTGNLGEPGLAAPIFNDAATVIAALQPIFPDPVELRARQAARQRAAR